MSPASSFAAEQNSVTACSEENVAGFGKDPAPRLRLGLEFHARSRATWLHRARRSRHWRPREGNGGRFPCLVPGWHR